MSSLLPILREKAPIMSLCSMCSDPGACCREFPLNMTVWKDSIIEEVRVQLKERDGGRMMFEPIGPDFRQGFVADPASGGREYGYWLFTCPKLVNGRCSVYETRPDCCRTYQPGASKMCCFHGLVAKDLSDD